MNKILVTGAAGFIGYHVSKRLLEEGKQVLGIDSINDYYDQRLKEYRVKQLKGSGNFSFVKINIEDFAALHDIFRYNQFDVVINLAARAGVRYSIENPHVYLSTNTQGTLNVLEMMAKYGVRKLILASSSSLYSGLKMPFREDLQISTPISPYAASKKAAEVMAYTYHYLFQIDVAILRFFSVYGPAGRPDMSYFRFIKLIDEGKPIEVYGDGNQARDFTYIDDIVEGTLLSMKTSDYEIFNLGNSDKPVSINNMIGILEEMLQKKAVIHYREFHKADMIETWADISKARQMLHWEPKISFESGIRKVVDWYLENKHWVKDLTI